MLCSILMSTSESLFGSLKGGDRGANPVEESVGFADDG